MFDFFYFLFTPKRNLQKKIDILFGTVENRDKEIQDLQGRLTELRKINAEIYRKMHNADRDAWKLKYEALTNPPVLRGSLKTGDKVAAPQKKRIVKGKLGRNV